MLILQDYHLSDIECLVNAAEPNSRVACVQSACKQSTNAAIWLRNQQLHWNRHLVPDNVATTHA